MDPNTLGLLGIVVTILLAPLAAFWGARAGASQHLAQQAIDRRLEWYFRAAELLHEIRLVCLDTIQGTQTGRGTAALVGNVQHLDHLAVQALHHLAKAEFVASEEVVEGAQALRGMIRQGDAFYLKVAKSSSVEFNDEVAIRLELSDMISPLDTMLAQLAADVRRQLKFEPLDPPLHKRLTDSSQQSLPDSFK